MQTKTITGYPATYMKKTKIKKTDNTKCCQGLAQLMFSYTDTERRNWYSHFGNVWQYPLSLNIGISSMLSFGIYPTEIFRQEQQNMH